MNAFTLPFIGGLIIGLAALFLLATLGKIAGISGIAWGAATGPDRSWRMLFLLGLLGGGLLSHRGFEVAVPNETATSWWLVLTSGLLVGIGTRMSTGCTSGHGVCGIGHRSSRSLFATLIFMTCGMATVLISNALTTDF